MRIGDVVALHRGLRSLAASTAIVCCGLSNAAEVQQQVNRDNGLKSWVYQGTELALELIQVPPDYIRASYAARNIPDLVTEAIANRCVFGTIIRNLANHPLSYNVAEWSYVDQQGQRKSVKTKSEWVKEWHQAGVRFGWTILADNPTFEVGDWIQGFTTMAEPHGSSLALTVVWHTNGERHELEVPGMECAPAAVN